MKKILQKNIVPFIVLIVLITIGIQVYWNIQNFKNNKKQIINTIQIALDKSIDHYYDDKIKSDILGKFTVVVPAPDKNNFIADSSKIEDIKNRKSFIPENDDVKIFTIPDSKKNDTLNLRFITEKTIVSMREDSIELSEIIKNLNDEFTQKQLNFEYALLYKRGNKVLSKYHEPKDEKFIFSTSSKSHYLPKSSQVILYYPDIFFKTIKEGLVGLIVSFAFSLIIVFCLFYLLSIIKVQKQMAIIKNEFISNISHELKTPIAVVVSALEGVENFTANNEPEKIKKYMAISKQHLAKLHLIVEKILETSALESDKLPLHKSNLDVVFLVNQLIEKFRINTEKNIFLTSSESKIMANVDSFHFENVISNLIDNAIKYGGNEITIHLKEEGKMIFIEISDNGLTIEKTHHHKIFDKFYRIPQNNLHNQKGFGIGLHYAKIIVEKHGGMLELISEPLTTFKISLPHE